MSSQKQDQEPREVILMDDEEIVLDSDGMEVRSDEEEPTQSDLDFIAPDDEVEAEVLLSQTVAEEMDCSVQNELADLDAPLPMPRLTRQSTVCAYSLTLDGPDGDGEDEEDEDYAPDSGGDGDDDFSDDED